MRYYVGSILVIGCSGGNFVLHLIIIAARGKTVMPSGIFSRKVEIVAHLRLQVGVTVNNPDACHVKVIVFFLQRRRTEAHAVAKTDVQPTYGTIAHA